jgi:hypothetical protein
MVKEPSDGAAHARPSCCSYTFTPRPHTHGARQHFYCSLISGRWAGFGRVIEGKMQGGIEVTGRQGRRRRKLLDDLKERGGYYHLKKEALDRSMWRARFGRGFGPVVRQTTK